MDIQNRWEKALRKTEIVRPRVQPLLTYADTQLPYIFLAESSVNVADTVVRKGEITVEKPAIILPSNLPQFEGFDSEETMNQDLDRMAHLFLVRGIRFPSFKYNNKIHSLDVFEGRLAAAINQHRRRLEAEENLTTGLVTGPEDCWQFSILIFIASQVVRQADGDIQKLFDDFWKKGPAR